MGKMVNLIKLSVGTESIEQLEAWQKQRSKQIEDGHYYHVTRMWPKREAEVTNGGSIYWVIKGEVQARQRVREFRERIGQDGIRRCAIMLEPEIIRVTPSLKRPFQGWRYLEPADAPMDLPKGRDQEAPLPDDLNRALAEIGVL
ncbi:DUF1489 domain containing protein [Sulfitobacter noctilucicola]|uniref:DUF1489 family protein n=1 Tax=Sulfitobacter noctilucicola TaxID=1342301 RepID=A0A7W6Q6I2_9RHOB|nr:DUF1489 domain-containing protein [Sulfitobacter noctilucicola]KIN63643.1 DUF1489 domain containing protein [Sulfitobacter noctilucicola]MBB4174847.1 hypothetical protein [Sulfitobacter noctilucicola]